jgi:hypothetical protein
MAKQGISDAFSSYGARLRNVNWSVSAWAPDGSLVVSMWKHHRRDGPNGSYEYADSLARWQGHGNKELRRNLTRAYLEKTPVRLISAETLETAHVESGGDAGKVKKKYVVLNDVIGEVISLDGDNYVIRFQAFHE